MSWKMGWSCVCVCIGAAVAWLHGCGVNDGIVVGAYCVVAGVITVVRGYELFCLLAGG